MMEDEKLSGTSEASSVNLIIHVRDTECIWHISLFMYPKPVARSVFMRAVKFYRLLTRRQTQEQFVRSKLQ